MSLIDAHTHIFKAVKGRVAASATSSLRFGKVNFNNKAIRLLPPLAIDTTFSAEILLEYMDYAGIDRAVLLQTPFYGEMNHYIYKTVKKWPQKFVGAAYIDLWRSNAKKVLDYVVNVLDFKIIKIEFSINTGFSGIYPGITINDTNLEWFWTECEKRNIIVILDLDTVDSLAYQTDGIKNIILGHPDLKIVISHLAHPPVNYELDRQKVKSWEEQAALAKYPNVWLDMAVLPSISFEEYPYPKTVQFIKKSIKLVGTDKIMWGSDMPSLLIHITYNQYISFVKKCCDFLTESDLNKILGENASKLFFENII